MTETLTANREERTVKGMLLPYGELSRNSNIGKIQFDKGTLTIPADADVVTANVRHDREDPRGRAIALEDTDAGLVATFRIAKTPEGDELLDDIENGKLTRLSAEVKGITRNGTKALTGALFGAAFVDEGAFETAALYAELATEEEEENILSAFTPEQLAELTELLSHLKAEELTTEEAPATEDNTGTESAAFTKETNLEDTSTAQVPVTLLACAATSTETPKPEGLHTVANAMAGYFRTKDMSYIQDLAPETRSAGSTMFAALNDIKSNYAGSVGSNIIQSQWVGEVWGTRSYDRKFASLIDNAALTSLTVKGYKYTTPATGGTWTGDKTAIPSSTPATTAVSVDAIRWAGGHDIAREFLDFQGQYPDFWESHYKQMSNDYARTVDTYVVDTLEAGASTLTAGTVPSGANASTVLIVDGALKVLEADATPSFAIVAPDVYRGLLLQNQDDLIATLSLQLGLEGGSLESFRIIPSTAVASGKAIVGSKDSATLYELPGVPIRTEALDIAKGGVDAAFFGYYTLLINNSAAVVKVTGA
jgi:hypothetical protein